MKTPSAFLALMLCAASLAARAETKTGDDPLAPWRSGVKISVISPEKERHTMHSYFNSCPESPDGKYVLYFASTARDGQHGDVCIRDRKTGEEKVLARDINTEDAHRVACQQWISNGKRVVFNGERNKEWFAGCVDVETGKESVLAHHQLAGWGQPNADLVPLYSLHWNPGEHRDMDLINAATGEKQTPVTVEALKNAYPDWFAKTFGDKKPSIFFPILSPDLTRVFFKMALASGNDPHSWEASQRQGLVCYSLAEKKFLYMSPKWGHPSWWPDSRHITEVHYEVYDSNDGKVSVNPGMPTKAARAAAKASGQAARAALKDVSGDHPSVSPDGKIVVTDTIMTGFGGQKNEWGVVLADVQGKDQIVIHSFDNSHGAESWRRSHPHPVFSADGKRIYFNVSSGPWTQLCVAERVTSGASLKLLNDP